MFMDQGTESEEVGAGFKAWNEKHDKLIQSNLRVAQNQKEQKKMGRSTFARRWVFQPECFQVNSHLMSILH